MIRWFAGLMLTLAAAPGLAQSPAIAIASQREADGAHRLTHETIVEAPIAEVWTAISTAEGWTAWATPVAWAGEDTIETSYTPTASPGDPSTIRQQILARLPGRILVFRTTKAPDGFPHFDTFSRVISFFELAPEGERRTRVRLTMTGYADTEAGRQLLGFFREGNRVSLDRLRRRFASGPLDWAREASTERH
jgi:uncharacterized protein YndB with AHSA1/START domain